MLRALRDRVGRIPREYDTYEYPDIPGHMVYVRRFGTWRKALETAGIPIDPRNMGYDRETLLAELRDIVDELGTTPTLEEVREVGGPAGTTFSRHFGSWTAALKELGLEPRTGGRYEDEELLNSLRQLAAELGHAPSVSEMQARADLPAPSTLRQRFGTWNGALGAAGLKPRHPTPERGSDGP